MPNTLKILQKAIQEDAKKGITQLRVLSMPIRGKRKSGEDIHKLPAPYPVIKEYEDEFKKDYSKLMNHFVLSELKRILK